MIVAGSEVRKEQVYSYSIISILYSAFSLAHNSVKWERKAAFGEKPIQLFPLSLQERPLSLSAASTFTSGETTSAAPWRIVTETFPVPPWPGGGGGKDTERTFAEMMLEL